MTRSILVVKYSFPLTVGEIFRKLDKKTFKIKYDDKNDSDKQIELEQMVLDVQQTTFGVEGHIRYHYQKKNEFKEEEYFDITNEECAFLFSPSANVAILHSSVTIRHRIIRFFAHVLHDGDNLFTPILIKKDELHRLMKKILDLQSGKNNLEEARFYHGDVPIDNLKKLSFTTSPDFCGTQHRLFYANYADCTHWDCTLRIHRCNGLLDEISERGYLLRINKDATISLNIDKTLKEWNRFVVETMKSAIQF